MSEKQKKILKRLAVNIGFPLITVAVLIAAYETAAALIDESLILPRLKEVLKEVFRQLTKPTFYKSLGLTLVRAFVSFAAALAVGGALGIASYKSRAAEKLLLPVMTVLRAIPTMAVIFLIVLWFRSGIAPAVVAFTVLMPLSYGRTRSALGSLDSMLFEMSKVYEVPKTRVLTKFVLPQIAPTMIDGAADDLSFSVKLVIAGEALAQTALGLGGMLSLANIYLETARLIVVTVLAVVVCFIIESAVRLLLIPLGRWR